MKKKKVLAIIGGGIQAGNFADACRRIGYESHYFSLPDGKIEDGRADYYHEINIFDVERIIEICKNIDTSGVVATTELSIAIAAKVAHALKLLGNSPEIAEVITDKNRNRNCIMNLNSLLSPSYLVVSSENELLESAIQFPIILKPTSQGGKRGISVARNRDELKSAFDYATKVFREGERPKIIVEHFMEGGIECSVESISYKGQHTIVQITQKDSSGAPHCVELGHHQPANINKEDWVKVVKGVTDGLIAIGLTNGCCHTEIKIIDGKVYLIEFNARPGGDCISHPLVQLSTGYDFFVGLAKAATGELEPIDVSSFKHNYAGLYYVVKQTQYLQPIFNICQDKKWCVKKNYVNQNLIELTHNDLKHTNYMIYASEAQDPIAKMLSDLNQT